MPLSHRFGRSLSIPIGTAGVVMGLAGILPTILSVLLTGSPPFTYTPLEAMDWAWTLVEAFETRYSPVLAMMILLTGIVITMINLVLCFHEFRYRRISVPERVWRTQRRRRSRRLGAASARLDQLSQLFLHLLGDISMVLDHVGSFAGIGFQVKE